MNRVAGAYQLDPCASKCKFSQINSVGREYVVGFFERPNETREAAVWIHNESFCVLVHIISEIGNSEGVQ